MDSDFEERANIASAIRMHRLYEMEILRKSDETTAWSHARPYCSVDAFITGHEYAEYHPSGNRPKGQEKPDFPFLMKSRNNFSNNISTIE